MPNRVVIPMHTHTVVLSGPSETPLEHSIRALSLANAPESGGDMVRTSCCASTPLKTHVCSHDDAHSPLIADL